MKTPRHTIHNFGLIATAATTLSTLRLRSMSSIAATVAQKPREAALTGVALCFSSAAVLVKWAHIR